MSVSRNPIIRVADRMLTRDLGIPRGLLPAILAVGIVGGLFPLLLLFALIVAAFAGSTWLLASLAAFRARLVRRMQGDRFLCPRCLRFGGFHYACAGCGREVDDLALHARSHYLDDCPHCRTIVRSKAEPDPLALRAYCRNCGASTHLAFHARRVRVLATLHREDFRTLLHTLDPGLEPPGSGRRELHYFYHDDGVRLTFVLNLDDSGRAMLEFPWNHAARGVQAFWIDYGALEPLALGQSVDAYFRHAALYPGERRSIPVCVGRATLEGAARRLLGSRFHHIRCQVPPDLFLGYSHYHVDQSRACSRQEAAAHPL